MENININRIVSTILEQIKSEASKEEFKANEFTFIDSIEKYMDIFQNQKEKPEDELEPELVGHEAEFNEMSRTPTYPVEKLPEPIRIPANMLTLGSRTKYLPPIKSADPENAGQFIDGFVVSDEIHIMPSGDRVLRFINHGENPPRRRYVVLAENRYLADLPRTEKTGNKWVKTDLTVAPEDETPEQREKRLKRIMTINEANAKRMVYPTIRQMFSDRRILNHLDICLIPETWADTLHTEHTTNKVRLKRFGGDTYKIDADFYAARDLSNINETIESMMDLRAKLALGEVGAETERKSQAKHLPRRHANYIYRFGGNWEGRQRVHDRRIFEEEGAETMIRKLNSKNIQKGWKEISIESITHITGDIVDDRYVLTAKFSATLNARDRRTGEGLNRGNLFEPIVVSLVKPVPMDIDRENFNMNTYPEFWINEGKSTTTNKTGFLPALITRLGNAILERIDPDEVQLLLGQLAEEYAAVEENN